MLVFCQVSTIKAQWFGGGYYDYLLDPRYAMMQAQQQMMQQQMMQQQMQQQIQQQVQSFTEQLARESQKQFQQNLQNNTFVTPVAPVVPVGPAMPVVPNVIQDTPVNKSESNKQNRVTSEHQCRVCGGSGQVVDNTYLGNASQTKWCDVCRKEVYAAHRHKRCDTCGGSGKISY